MCLKFCYIYIVYVVFHSPGHCPVSCMIVELPIRRDFKWHMIIITFVGGGGGGSGFGGGDCGDGIVHSLHKINSALCAKLIMTFAIVCNKLLFI